MGCRTSVMTLLALACLLPIVLAQNEAFEDCATTTFKIANNKVFASADVFKYTKLTVGQGTMDCMALCRANDECWAFNFDKSKKWCYLINQGGSNYNYGSRRRYLWSSGFKVCVAHSDDSEWDNIPTDSATLKATGLIINNGIVSELTEGVSFVWNAAVATTNYDGAKTPTYRVVCGHNDADWHCDETPVWASALTTETFLADQNLLLTDLAEEANMKCFVETYINNIKVACSAGSTSPLTAGAQKIKVHYPTVGPDVSVSFIGSKQYDYRVACYNAGYNGLCSNDLTVPVVLGAWVNGNYPDPAFATISSLAAGSYTCFLRYRAANSYLFAGCSGSFPVNVA